MGLHDQTPIYIRTVELIKEIYKASHHVNREYKYTLMQDMKRDSMLLTRSIYRANISQDKLPYLQNLADDYEFLKLEIRLCNDLKVITTASYAKLILLMEDIGRQITGWRKSVNK